MERGGFDAAVQDRTITGVEVALKAGDMSRAMACGNDRVGQRTAARFGVRPAEDLLRARVPPDDETAAIDRDDRIERGIEDLASDRKVDASRLT
jgi:hypothetical protein